MQQLFDPIHIIGPIGSLCDGIALYNRQLIRTLVNNNYPVKVTSAETGNNPNVPVCLDPEIINVVKSTKDLIDPEITINATIPPLYRVNKGINIGLTSWETSILPSDWVQKMNQQHAIFVPSKSLIEIYKHSGVKAPMYVLGYPLDFTSLSKLKKTIIEPSISRKVTYLYSGNWVPRKNIEDLCLAYCLAFENIKDVSLVIKTWALNNDTGSRQHIEAAIRHLCNKVNGLTHRPRIHICTDPVEDNESNEIINGADVFVTTSRGEGVDIGLTTAIALNKYTICDGFLAHGDLVSNKKFVYNAILRPVIDSGTPFHAAKMAWSTPDIINLVGKFRDSYSTIIENTSKNISPKHYTTIEQTNSSINVFNSLLAYLEEIKNKYGKQQLVPISR